MTTFNFADNAYEYGLYADFKYDQPKCELSRANPAILECFNFNSWSQLLGAVMNTTKVDLTQVNYLQVRPNVPLVLTKELDWRIVSNIICSLANLNAYACNQQLTISISDLKGVDITSGWKKNRHFNSYMINFFSSTMSFQVNGDAQYECSEAQMIQDAKKNITYEFFNYMKFIVFDKSIVYNNENRPVCPYWFANVNRLQLMSIDGIVDSFLVKNIFRFQSSNSSKSINSTVDQLLLGGYNYALDRSLIHSLVYEQIAFLNIQGTIASIANDLFKSFYKFKVIQFNVVSLVNFFHRVGMEWTRHLAAIQTFVYFKEDEKNLTAWLNPGGAYTYSNRDLCIFASVPIQQNSVVTFLNSKLTVCTDTAAWLTQNYDKIDSSYFMFYAWHIYETCLHNYQMNLTEIETKIKRCPIFQNYESGVSHNQNGVYVDFYDIIYAFQFVNDLLEFVIIPFACILGLLLNLRVIYTVHKNSKVELKEDFYKYMMINSVFNCICCVMYALYPINYCGRYETGYFCSAIFNTLAAQVVKIVLQAYFGEAIKMCSNISYIFITLNRYTLVGKEHNKTLKSISKINVKLVVFFIVSFSLLMNIGHAFQYRINWGGSSQNLDYNFLSYLYPTIVIFNSSFQVYAIVYFFINFVLFLAVNTSLEFSLLRNLRNEIEQKRTKLEKEIQESWKKSTSKSRVVSKVNMGKQKKIDQDKIKETRAILMVIFNSGMNFFLRFPEIFVFVSSNSHFIINSSTAFGIENTLFNNLSSILVNLSYLFYVLTFTTNVLVYCVFNPNFKKHFILWKYNVKSK
jgi:hypothetical protein